MKQKQIAFGIVGVLIGLILGFFSSQALLQSRQTSPVAQPAQVASGLPEGHPPIDQLEQIQALEAHASEHPDHADVKIQLGNAYYDMKRFDSAIQWYEEALKIEPENVDVNNDLATSYFATGAADKAIATFERSLEIEADNPIALQNLGWIHFVKEDYRSAVDTWSRLVSVHPDYERLKEVKEHLERARAQLSGART